MKKIFLLLSMFCATTVVMAQEFDSLFYHHSLRMDVYHVGTATEDAYEFDKFSVEQYWAGPESNLIDKFEYGSNIVRVYDVQSQTLIYSRGYCSLFAEWQVFGASAQSPEARYPESVSIPLPKKKVVIEISERDKEGNFAPVFSKEYIPAEGDLNITRKNTYPVYNAVLNGSPFEKVDIVVIPDGYTEEEMDKFKSDCDKLVGVLATFEPFKSHVTDFNVRAVLAPSQDSGTDIPHDKVFKNTVLNTGFDTFGIDRYCMTEDFFAVKDVASAVPYDQIYILVNSTVYGGGGIYNYYSLSTAGNMSSAKVIIHEFGHAFAGLGDEYAYGDDPATEEDDFYHSHIEPWEPNITTLHDFSKKWERMLEKDTPVPTPLEKRYIQKTGVFEGAGYTTTGVYRPAVDCLMNSFKGDTFCEVCADAIERMIGFYTRH